jgi:hypothetical protein
LIAHIQTNDLLYRIRGTQHALMDTMNSFDRTPTTPAVFRPATRVPDSDVATDSQQSECCCPELCQLDHSN